MLSKPAKKLGEHDMQAIPVYQADSFKVVHGANLGIWLAILISVVLPIGLIVVVENEIKKKFPKE